MNYKLIDLMRDELMELERMAQLLKPITSLTLPIEKVIFNYPATIILWSDGTKTVVKCQPGDTYDEEKGFVMAYLKKLLGNDNTFNKEIKKYCIEQYVKED
jgi:hypothetical protein